MTSCLTPTQQGMLYHCLAAPGSGIDIDQIVVTLPEAVDVPVFRRAWQRLADRHEALRMRFVFDAEGNARQYPLAQASIIVDERDWTAAGTEQQEHLFASFLKEDRVLNFDPRADLPTRVTLIRLGESAYRFVWTWWHGIMDARATVILLRELFFFYEAFREGRAADLPLPRPYTDYAEWLNTLDLSEARGYWTKLLKGYSEPPVIGTPGKAAGPTGFEEYSVRLAGPESARLRAAAEAAGVTMNAMLQAAWALVLARHTGQSDVVFGVTRACRRGAFGGDGSGEEIVGALINTTPVRVNVCPDSGVGGMLRSIRAQHLSVRPYEHTPLASIQQWSEAPSDRRLFETIVVFDYQSIDSILRSQGGAWASRRFALLGRIGYPVVIYVWNEEQIHLQIEYDCSRISTSAARRMLGHLVTALASIAASPTAKTCDLPLLTDREIQQFDLWNDTRAAYLSDLTAPELFERQAEASPESIAVSFEDSALTYRELTQRANRLARYLQRRGIRHGALVGIHLHRSMEMLVAVLGILKAGAAYVPLDPGFPPERLEFMASDAGLALIVTETSLPALGTCLTLVIDSESQQIGREIAGNPEPRPDAASLAYVLYTSGSTGKPKGVAISHRALTNFLCSMQAAPGCGERDVLLAITTLSFDIAGLELFLPLVTGARVALVSREASLDGRLLAAELERIQPDILQATPATWRMLIDAGWKGSPGLKALCGGEALPQDLAAQLLERTGELWNMYGPTETTIWSAIHKVSRDEEEITIGGPIANTEILVLDANQRRVPVGVAGELYIGGDGLAQGYHNRAELTRERFVPHPFSKDPASRLYRTGDLAQYREDGRILLLGRLDHQVKLRGFRIELGEIEAALAEHPLVRQAAVLLREDTPGDRRLVAYVVANPPSAPEEIQAFAKKKLPVYMAPSAVVMLASMPLTPNGKLDRRALPAPDNTLPRGREHVAPATPLEADLARIWAEVLGVDPAGTGATFFELGGHSLLATKLLARVEDAFGVRLRLGQFLDSPTIGGMATAITELKSQQIDADLLQQMLAELEELTAEEAQALLAGTNETHHA